MRFQILVLHHHPPIFITKHLNLNQTLAKSLISTNNHSVYLLHAPKVTDNSSSSSKELYRVCSNNDHKYKWTQISKCSIVGFSDGIYCLASYDRDRSHIIYLWNPSIRKLKKPGGCLVILF